MNKRFVCMDGHDIISRKCSNFWENCNGIPKNGCGLLKRVKDGLLQTFGNFQP